MSQLGQGFRYFGQQHSPGERTYLHSNREHEQAGDMGPVISGRGISFHSLNLSESTVIAVLAPDVKHVVREAGHTVDAFVGAP